MKRIYCTIAMLAIAVGLMACSSPKVPADDEDWLLKGLRLYQEQKFEEAFGRFHVARVLAHMEGNKDKEFQALKGLADCAFWIGSVDSCIYWYTKAIPLVQELNRPYEEYRIYSQLKQAYLTKVDMQNVFLVKQKIDSLTPKTKDKRIRIGLQLQLAQEAIQQQNTRLAEQYLLANESLLDSISEDERQSIQFTVYGYLCDYYFGIQDFEKARKYSLLYTSAGKNEFKDQPLGYMTYDKEALICAQQNNHKAAFAALDSMKHGLTLTKFASKVNEMHYHEVKGRVHAMFGEWAQACSEYREALSVVVETDVTYRADYFRVKQLLGEALSQDKKYEEARECYTKLMRYCIYQYGEESLANADVLWALANLERYSGDIENGKQYYIKSVDICKRLVSDNLKYISVQERDAFWYSFAPKMFAMAAYALKIGENQSSFTEKCYEALLFSKSLLLESDRTMALAISTECTKEEKQVYYEMLCLQNQLKALTNDYEKNKDRIENLHRKISVQNQQLTPIISRLGFTTFLNQGYDDIKKSLTDDEVLLDFTDFVSDEQQHQHIVYAISRNQQHPKLIKGFTEKDIQQVLQGKPIDELYNASNSEAALRLFWDPVAEAVEGKRAIFYVPSGLMHQIAFENIPLKDGSLLGDHYRFIRLTSAREIIRTNEHDNLGLNTTAILYGGLKYDMDTIQMSEEALNYSLEPMFALNRGEAVRGDGSFKALPNSKEEVEVITTVLRKRNIRVTPRTGTKGTEESFLAMSGNAPQILHIATHGFYYIPEKANDVAFLKGYSDAMQLSGLILSGGNLAWTGKQIPKGVLGGVLTANSIANLNLKGTELVVLSACQTGKGKVTPEGVYGLQRAFKKAGVQTIIMSLWNLSDKVTKNFMIKFYEELANDNNNWDKRKAFENAKTYIRSNPDYSDPYYWAGFIMLD